MQAVDVVAFACGSLPAPPARVLEVGAGDGELAGDLRSVGYDVLATGTTSGVSLAGSISASVVGG